MLEFLVEYGDLSPDYFYRGSSRSGYTVMPGAATLAGTIKDPLDMRALLNADLWSGVMSEEEFAWQATMFQPVGGMDRIPAAFQKRLGPAIRFDCPIERIRKTAGGVRVSYRDRKTGIAGSVDANYCICALPFSVLKHLDTDFSPDVKQVIDGVSYDDAYKIAGNRRVSGRKNITSKEAFRS